MIKMMSVKQWLVLLCIFFGYIVFGASVFYFIESEEEVKRHKEELREKYEIEDLIENHYVPNELHTKNELFEKMSNYCDKPLGENPDTRSLLNWTFYHAMFFVLTVISTIGYGNLAPTTTFTRVFVIVYGIIGIPMNGIVVISLGDFFGRSFYKLYKRWKNLNMRRALATLGLIGQIILYSIPGITLFIIIPSLIIVLYEEWTYDIAVEFAFGTLTTVGVGNRIPGTDENGHGEFVFFLYKTFLMFWIIMGLGYLAMVFGFISRGLRSKHMHKLEHKITRNIKKTNRKIRRELRSLLNEYLVMRVKPVYRERRINALMACQRTQSCPDLRIGNDLTLPKIRKRAFSELPRPAECSLNRGQSDTDLQCIDKEQTFKLEEETNANNKLLLRVVNALSNYNTMACSTLGSEDTDTFFDNSESHWSRDDKDLSSNPLEPMRPRSATETKRAKWTGHLNVSRIQRTTAREMQENHEREKYGKARSRTLPPIAQPQQSLFTRLKNTFRRQSQNEDLERVIVGIERQNSTAIQEDPRLSELSMANKDHLLEETTLAEFLRALTIINFRDVPRSHRRYGTVDTSFIPRTRRLPIITPVMPVRKASLIPSSPSHETKQRRLSLNPVPVINNYNNFTPLASPVVPLNVAGAFDRKIATPSRKFSFALCRNIHKERKKSVSLQKIVDCENKGD